jgi:hypothetical protein
MTMAKTNKWSQEITEHSHALDLEEGVFSLDDPHRIALSLQKSAEESKNRKASAFQSAMSMLNFYINRAGRKLSSERKKILEDAKVHLRELFGRSEQ